jgi:(p)ppGpp synthase/HD superfamily hydrolase
MKNRVMRMSYLEKAIELAVEKHKGQVDKGGAPYILHPLFILTRMDTETEKIVAVLHDIIEDTEVTFKDLKSCGFSDEVLNALQCLTRRNDEDYFIYIERIKNNPIAIKVKLADLEHNMDLRRIKNLTDQDVIRSVKKYKRAWDELRNHS